MQDIQDIRIANLKNLLANERFKGSQAELGRVLGKASGAIIYQWINKLRPVSEKTARDIEVKLHLVKGAMDWPDGKPPAGEDVPRTTSGRQLTAREEIIMDLVCGLTPEQQEELLPALRAAFDANRATQKLLGSSIKTVGNRRIEDEFGRPGERVKGKS